MHGQCDGLDNTTHDQRNNLHDFHCNTANILQCRATLSVLVDPPDLITHVFGNERKCARTFMKAIYSSVEVKCQKKFRAVVSITVSSSLILGTVRFMGILHPHI